MCVDVCVCVFERETREGTLGTRLDSRTKNVIYFLINLSFLGYVVLKRGAQSLPGSLDIKPSGSGDENAACPVANACAEPYHLGVGRRQSQPRGILIREQARIEKPISMVRLTADSSS